VSQLIRSPDCGAALLSPPPPDRGKGRERGRHGGLGQPSKVGDVSDGVGSCHVKGSLRNFYADVRRIDAAVRHHAFF